MRTKKCKQYVKLGGEEFEIVNDVKLTSKYDITTKNLYQCYNKPSTRKELIFRYYYSLLNNYSDLWCYGVRSYNCNFITLHGLTYLNDELYYFNITPSHNTLAKVVLLSE